LYVPTYLCLCKFLHWLYAFYLSNFHNYIYNEKIDCKYVWMYMNTHDHKYVCVYVSIWSCININIYLYTYTRFLYAYAYIHMTMMVLDNVHIFNGFFSYYNLRNHSFVLCLFFPSHGQWKAPITDDTKGLRRSLPYFTFHRNTMLIFYFS
jgi:hypothetical protein